MSALRRRSKARRSSGVVGAAGRDLVDVRLPSDRRARGEVCRAKSVRRLPKAGGRFVHGLRGTSPPRIQADSPEFPERHPRTVKNGARVGESQRRASTGGPARRGRTSGLLQAMSAPACRWTMLGVSCRAPSQLSASHLLRIPRTVRPASGGRPDPVAVSLKPVGVDLLRWACPCLPKTTTRPLATA